MRQQRRKLSSQDPQDPTYRRLRYVRYADDWALGFSGPKAEAEEIKRDIRTFLRETLKVELSEEKTLITHTRTSAAKFLGYEIVSQHVDDKLDYRGQRQVNEMMALRVPKEVIEQKCALYMRGGKPAQRAEMIRESDYSIRSPVSIGVPRDSAILSPGSECGLVQHVALGSANIVAQNPRRQTPVYRHQDGEEAQNHHGDGAWTKKVLASGYSPWREQETARSPFWGHPPQTEARSHSC